MVAYVITIVRRVHDRKGLEKYWSQAPSTTEGTGVRPLSVYKPAELVEGTGPVEGVVLLEFPNVEAARNWYFSDAYQSAKRLRDGAADEEAIIVEEGIETNPMPHIK